MNSEDIKIWKSLKGIVENGDYYEVSNLGDVRSIDGVDRRGLMRKGKILSIRKNKKTGYLQVNLYMDNKDKTYNLHRLVALAFIPNLDNKPEVNHKDGDKENCIVENLEWVTDSENQKHSWDNELNKGNEGMKGEGNIKAKIKKEDVIKIRTMYGSGEYSYRDLSEIFSISKSAVRDIIKYRNWKHIP